MSTYVHADYAGQKLTAYVETAFYGDPQNRLRLSDFDTEFSAHLKIWFLASLWTLTRMGSVCAGRVVLVHESASLFLHLDHGEWL